MSSSKSDPRRTDNVVAFHLPPKKAEETDWAGTLAMVTAMAGIMVRNQYKFIPWVAAYFGLASVLNSKKSQRDDLGGYSGGLLALVSIMTYYMNMYFAYKQTILHAAQTDVANEGL